MILQRLSSKSLLLQNGSQLKRALGLRDDNRGSATDLRQVIRQAMQEKPGFPVADLVLALMVTPMLGRYVALLLPYCELYVHVRTFACIFSVGVHCNVHVYIDMCTMYLHVCLIFHVHVHCICTCIHVCVCVHVYVVATNGWCFPIVQLRILYNYSVFSFLISLPQTAAIHLVCMPTSLHCSMAGQGLLLIWATLRPRFKTSSELGETQCASRSSCS